jgi:hypothetical protein
MGMFYTNFTVRGPLASRVLAVLRSASRDAYAATVAETTVICDRMADAFDTAEVESFARLVSAQLRAPVLTVINHDDGVLLCLLHAGTELIFQYTSDRSYFAAADPGPEGDDPALLAQAFRRDDHADEVARVLGLGDEPATFTVASDRHAALCDALGLPRIAVGAGYDQVAEKDLPPDLAAIEFVKA